MAAFAELLRGNLSGRLDRIMRHATPRFGRTTVVIGVHAGGLGDHLAYSVLPRLYKHAGAAKVLVSTRTNCGEPFARNPETIDLVWKPNPHVDGFTDEPPNVGETRWPPHAFLAAAKRTPSPVDTVAEVHGLSLPVRRRKRLWPPRPDLFYRPKGRPDFTGKAVCDPNSISQGFTPSLFNAFVAFNADWHGIDTRDIVVLGNAYSGQARQEILPDSARYAVRDIFEYTDIIASARSFLVTESGGQSIAAAVRSSATFVLTTTRAFNQRHFIWPTNTYCVTGGMTPHDAEWQMRPRPIPP